MKCFYYHFLKELLLNQEFGIGFENILAPLFDPVLKNLVPTFLAHRILPTPAPFHEFAKLGHFLAPLLKQLLEIVFE